MNQTADIILGTIALVLFLAAVGWFVFRTIRRAEDPARMAFKWVLTLPLVGLCIFSIKLGPFGPFLVVACGIVFSILWTPHLGALVAKPLTSLFDGGSDEVVPQPAYSTAQSRQKQGRYVEAVMEIRKQLDRFPTDLEGHVLLAQIQSEDLKDLSSAQLTIDRLCSQSGHSPKNLAFALYSMTDWHLKIGRDFDAARRNLEKIIELFPESEFALGAAQRIAHLGSPEMLQEKKFAVIEGVRNLGLLQDTAKFKPDEADPRNLAAAYVEHLGQHPFDTDAREKLASIYVDHYDRLDLATDQLEQMIQQPNQPARSVVHWLNFLADLQIRCGADHETVKQTLERIIELYPALAAADVARNRLSRLKLEMKSKVKTQAVKLGQYEQNIGLKRGSPPH